MEIARADQRLGQAWTWPQRAKNDALYWAAMSAIAATSWLSRKGILRVGRFLGEVAHVFARAERERARCQIESALKLDGDECNRVVRACFRAMGDMLGESLATLHNAPTLYEMPISSRDILAEACAEGKGVVLPSAHLGAWERVAATLVAAGVPLVTLVRESYDPRFDFLFAKIRERGGVKTIPRGSPNAALKIVRTLRAGRVLGAPMDLRSRVPSALVRFLGQPAWTALGPATIALRSRAPVVVATLERVEVNQLAVTATRIETKDLDWRSEDAKITLTGRINDELSRRIRTAPELWPWMHPRWQR